MTPTASDLRSFMRQRKRGYRLAAEHYGITEDEARRIVAEADPKAGPRAPARAREADPEPAPLTTTEQLARKVAEVRASRSAAEAKGSYTASATLHKLESDLLRQLSEIEQAEADRAADRESRELAGASPGEVLEGLVQLLLDGPELDVEYAHDALAAHLAGRVAVPGGRIAWLRAAIFDLRPPELDLLQEAITATRRATVYGAG